MYHLSNDHERHQHERGVDGGGDHIRLAILLDSDCAHLKGTGLEVDPVLLSGHVYLILTEPTPIKQITLKFKGEATLPRPGTKYIHSKYSLCNHDWSFLEGEKRQGRMLKAGRHLFPFRLQLGGSLPSSMAGAIARGIFVQYKLQARAIRHGLFHDLRVTVPVFLIRSFTPDALEYQQTVDVEGSWMDKLAYSITIPHKAWSIDDLLVAHVHLSPLTPRVNVLSVLTSIQETTQINYGVRMVENVRSLVELQHDIIDGRVVLANASAQIPSSSNCASPSDAVSHVSGLPSQNKSPHTLTMSSPHVEPSRALSVTCEKPVDAHTYRDGVIDTYLNLPIPSLAIPSSNHDPLTVTHRLRWSIRISNPDGHISELRCSLPIHLLDKHLANEVHSLTATTRRLFLELPSNEDAATLPSYDAHVRDRVANMFLPDAATVRVTNPWVRKRTEEPTNGPPLCMPGPIEHQPTHSATCPRLDWVNAELLLSLSASDLPHLAVPSAGSDTPGRERVPVFMHADSQASRQMHGIFEARVTPEPSHTLSLFSPVRTQTPAPACEHQPAVTLPTPRNGAALLRRALTQVPDYSIASRGFIGGVTPLSSMSGLPPYE